MRTNMVFYDTYLIGTNTFHISGNTGINLMAGGTTRMNINNSQIVLKREAKLEVHSTTSQAANTFMTTAGRVLRSTSSMRYKRDVEDHTDEAAYRWLDQARPVSFYGLNDEDPGQALGFIAEEVDTVEPRYITYDEEGRPDGVQYASIVSTLTKICQLQEQRIKALEEKLNG